MLRRTVLCGGGVAFSAWSFPSIGRTFAKGSSLAYESNFQTVQAIFKLPEPQMDLASIKLAIDRMIDPAIDQAVVLRQLEALAVAVRASFPLGASNLVKFKALRDYLYQPALLSGRKPFLYNLEDDTNPRSKLLSVYLATQKGNCVSMPFVGFKQSADERTARDGSSWGRRSHRPHGRGRHWRSNCCGRLLQHRNICRRSGLRRALLMPLDSSEQRHLV